MASAPAFVSTPNCLPVAVAAANLASDGSGSLVTLLTAGASGSRVDAITWRNAQTTQAASSAMLGKLFLSDAAGANPRLVGEALIPAATRSATILGATITFTFSPALVMKSGQILYTTQSIYASAADAQHVLPFGGDF